MLYLYFLCSGFLRNFLHVVQSKTIKREICLNHRCYLNRYYYPEDQGVVAIKGYSLRTQSQDLKPYYWMLFNTIHKTLVLGKYYPSAGYTVSLFWASLKKRKDREPSNLLRVDLGRRTKIMYFLLLLNKV